MFFFNLDAIELAITVRINTFFFFFLGGGGGKGEMQDLATVTHISFFSGIKNKMESTDLYGHFPKDFQTYEYSMLTLRHLVDQQ